MAVPLLFPFRCEKKIKSRRLLEQLSDFEVRQTCGVPLPVVRDIVNLYNPLNGKLKTGVPLETKVLLFLTQLRTGSFQKVCGGTTGVSQPTASRIIDDCVNHTLTFASQVIDFPSTVHELNVVKQKYYDIAGLSGVVGVVDGTHVPIKAPSDNEPAYVNRKFFHSINCQVISDSTYKIFDIVAKWPGSTHDSFVWKNSSARRRLHSGEFGNTSHFLADSGYGAEPKLKIPLRGNLTNQQETFNRALKKTRSTVERAIGNWKSRFRSMHGTGGDLCYTPSKTCKLIVSSIVLHNIFISNNIPILEEDEDFMHNFLQAQSDSEEDN